jgi:hypothetical protein
MENDKPKSQPEENKEEKPLLVHNPLDPSERKQITEEDMDNEQKYKEALTERD